MILWGMVLRKCVSNVGRDIPSVHAPPVSANQALVDLIRGTGPKPQPGRLVSRHRSAPRN
jgi:hypothetical protein